MKVISKLIRLSLCLFLIAGLSGCGEDPPPKPMTIPNARPVSGDALVEGSIGDASNLIPYIASDTSSSSVTALVYNGLIKLDKDMNIAPDLADSWEISDDGLTITFKLKQGVKWHDGQEFTAEDCVFTHAFVTDPNTPTPYSADFLLIETAEALDRYTFRVKYKQPFARALYAWLGSIVPKHLLAGRDVKTSSLARQPVGTGPYTLLSWKTGTAIELKAFPDYFEGRAYLDRVIFKIIPDLATMFLELKAGNVDMMSLTPLQYSRQTETPEFKARFNKYKYLASAYTYLGYNLKNKLFQDKRVRQALSYAINRQEIIDGVLMGYGLPATGGFKPGTWAHNPNIKPYPFDPEKAKAMLAEAGWVDSDGDGVLDKDGAPFQFTIVTNQGNAQRLKTGIIIQQRFKEIGVQVKIRAVEWAALLKEFIDKQAFDATIMGWTLPSDPDPNAVWHSSKAEPGGLNFISFKNAEVDELIDGARRTVDQEARKKAYFRFQEIIHEEQPYNFLFVPDSLLVVAARIHGIEPAPAGIGHNFIRWFVPKSLQKYSYQP